MRSKEKVLAVYGVDGYKVIQPTSGDPLWKLKLWDDVIGVGASELLMWQNAAESIPAQPEPKFQQVYCSQCGGEFGPRDGGYSHCEDHQEPLSDRDSYLIEEGLRACKEGDSMRCGKSETEGWICRRKLAHSGPCAPEPVAPACGNPYFPKPGILAYCKKELGHEEMTCGKPVAPVEAQEKDQCGANLGMYECRLDYGHPNDHDDQGVKWLNSFNVAEPKPTPSTPDEPHKNGWHYGYITCSCGWAWDSRNTLTGSLATQHGLRIFEKHKAEVSKPQPDSSSIPDGPTCSCGHPKAFHYEDMRGKQCSYGDHTICPCKGFNAAAPSPLLHDGVVEVWTKARNPEHQVCQSMAIELQAWRKWVKGHSNGR